MAYREDAGIRSFVRKTAALAFVPVRFVRLAWQAIKAEAPEHDGITEFAAYLERTWLVGNYPPVLWNVYETQQTRTNNRLEGWHSKMKKVVGKAHPNVFEIVEVFKAEQASTEVSLAQFATGATPPRRARRTVDKDKRIAELKRRFANNAISLEDYVRGISGHTGLNI